MGDTAAVEWRSGIAGTARDRDHKALLRWSTSAWRVAPVALLCALGPWMPTWRANPTKIEVYLGPVMVLLLPFLLRFVWRHVVRGGAIIAFTPTGIELDGRVAPGFHRVPWSAVRALRFEGRKKAGAGGVRHAFLHIDAEVDGKKESFSHALALAASPGGRGAESATLDAIARWVARRNQGGEAVPGRLDEFLEATRG